MAVDATGKVGARSAGLDDAVRVTTNAAKAADATRVSKRDSAQDSPALIDRINLDISKNIQRALDPDEISLERKEKIAKLKELIESGQYKPSSEAIAQSLSQELVQEIYFADPQTKSKSTDSLIDLLGEKEG
jgi:anti-sigma28 factor (negative regulator of flagellin synthesis)